MLCVFLAYDLLVIPYESFVLTGKSLVKSLDAVKPLGSRRAPRAAER